MLGAFAVGKTSLVKRYVEDIFSEKYQATIGVKIDKKTITVEGQTVELILWDFAGNDEYHKIRTSYLRGASGYLLVLDKTRVNTFNAALDIHSMVQGVLGNVPFLLLINKWDLEGKKDIDKAAIAKLRQKGWEVIKTSAKTSMGVNEAFETLARRIVELGT